MQRSFRLALVLLVSLISIASAAAPKATIRASVYSVPISPMERNAIAVVIDIPEGYHVQSHTPLDPDLIAMKVSVASPVSVHAEPAVYPDPTIENYTVLGKVSVYTKQVIVYVPFTVAKDTNGAITIEGVVSYQMCDDKTCLLPARAPFKIETAVQQKGSHQGNDGGDFEGFDRKLLAAPATLPTTVPTTQAAAAPTPLTDSSALTPTSLLGAIGIALVVGVIFNVMPCVLPVLPLKAVGFYEAAQHDRRKTVGYGLLFAAGMITMFLLLACVVLLSKQILGRQFQWGQQFSYPSFVWTMAIILGVLGFGMLGFFAVRLPTGVYGFNFRHDTLIGNFMWGGLTAILSTPCTAPLFPPLLAWAIGQPLVSGFLVMIAVGVGMALPYVILSAFPELARKFPRTGPFAELFKQMMGFLLIGSAAWFVGIRLLGDPNQWWLVFSIAVIAGAYLIFRTRQILPTPRAISIAVVLALLLISTSFAGTLKLTNVPRGWVPFTTQSFATAKSSKQIVLIEFSASWCLNCKYIEQTVYRDQRTLDALAKYNVVTIKADLTDYSAPGWQLLNDLGGTGIPFTAIYTPGVEMPIMLESIYTTDTLLNSIAQARQLQPLER